MPVSLNLFTAAYDALMLSDPATKIAQVRALHVAFQAGHAVPAPVEAPVAIDSPGRPVRPLLVAPRELAHRGLGTAEGRAALIHAVAHIEFNAINLALDAVYRFRDLPHDYYADWLQVAVDEARHFELLQARLADLGHGYGDFPAHNGLWEAAQRTAHDCVTRMALVPRVLEARGLDVTPGMIGRLRDVGDHATIAVLELILAEEVAHVAAGTRWFRHGCERAGLDPELTFLDLLRRYEAAIRPPFNREARALAGFSEAEQAGVEALVPSRGR